MIELREYKKSDTDILVLLANNKRVSRYLVYTFPYPYTRRNADWRIAVGAKENGALNKVIEYHGEFVGSVGNYIVTQPPHMHISDIVVRLTRKYYP